MSNRRMTGLWTALASWVLVCYIGWEYTPDPMAILNELKRFFTGGINSIPVNDASFLVMLPVILLVVAIEVPANIMTATISSTIAGKRIRQARERFFDRLRGGTIFRVLFLVVFLEEVVFRWLLLGLGTRLFTGPVAFYVILLSSNALFAYVHLGNYKDKRDQQVVRVLPQFVGGLFLSYIFVKYGLVASTVAHFAMNAILLATAKMQRTDLVDGISIGLHALYAFVAYRLLDKPLMDILVWFSGEEITPLTGWEFWDYVLMITILTSCFHLVADLLLYDKNLATSESGRSRSSGGSYELGGLLIAGAIIFLFLCLPVLLIYGLYLGAGFFIEDVPFRVLVSAIVLVTMTKNSTISSAQRSFWVGIPSAFLAICVIESLGFWGAVGYFAVSILISLPHYVIIRLDD